MSISLASFNDDFNKLTSISDSKIKFYTTDDIKNVIKQTF